MFLCVSLFLRFWYLNLFYCTFFFYIQPDFLILTSHEVTVVMMSPVASLGIIGSIGKVMTLKVGDLGVGGGASPIKLLRFQDFNTVFFLLNCTKSYMLNSVFTAQVYIFFKEGRYCVFVCVVFLGVFFCLCFVLFFCFVSRINLVKIPIYTHAWLIINKLDKNHIIDFILL